MADEQIKAALAPCGLSCEKCFAHVNGDIRRYSLELKEKLGNFDIYAKRFETMLGDPIFKKYPDFKEMLDYFASENCKGCRNEHGTNDEESIGRKASIGCIRMKNWDIIDLFEHVKLGCKVYIHK